MFTIDTNAFPRFVARVVCWAIGVAHARQLPRIRCGWLQAQFGGQRGPHGTPSHRNVGKWRNNDTTREENPILTVEAATMSPHGGDSEKQDSWRSVSIERMISEESLLLPNQNNVNPILSQLGMENPLIAPLDEKLFSQLGEPCHPSTNLIIKCHVF